MPSAARVVAQPKRASTSFATEASRSIVELALKGLANFDSRSLRRLPHRLHCHPAAGRQMVAALAGCPSCKKNRLASPICMIRWVFTVQEWLGVHAWIGKCEKCNIYFYTHDSRDPSEAPAAPQTPLRLTKLADGRFLVSPEKHP